MSVSVSNNSKKVLIIETSDIDYCAFAKIYVKWRRQILPKYFPRGSLHTFLVKTLSERFDGAQTLGNDKWRPGFPWKRRRVECLFRAEPTSKQRFVIETNNGVLLGAISYTAPTSVTALFVSIPPAVRPPAEISARSNMSRWGKTSRAIDIRLLKILWARYTRKINGEERMEFSAALY